MQHDIPTILRKIMEKTGTTQAELAERLTERRKGIKVVDQSMISRWLRGVMPETRRYNRIMELAADLGIIGDVRSEDVAEGLTSAPTPRKVRLKGYVGAGSEAHFYALSDEDFEEVEAPLSATDQTIAVEIKGTSFGPLMDSWLVYYDDVRSPITDDLLNKICVVGLADDRILVKKIVRDGNGGFNLKSNSESEPDMIDVEIEWAARVTDMKPRS